jgi:hypothetical protein
MEGVACALVVVFGFALFGSTLRLYVKFILARLYFTQRHKAKY